MFVGPGRCTAGELRPGAPGLRYRGYCGTWQRDAISPGLRPHGSQSFVDDRSTRVDFNLRAYGLDTPKTSRSSPILF